MGIKCPKIIKTVKPESPPNKSHMELEDPLSINKDFI